ncbi:hypothetical protein KY495_13260 [Massilia sp. PAMC28688]|uniref:hypothetical protein n=1 Tax=Massilia sp. PAMC28688 TaxID=2861283 RepID=UPI001C6336EC|nr:hypothetical protein [Massilia sp. PAMC28688]QYF91766.1 hypothetical protein KY495_13260 [Massilia sp. PAMC28688]
MFDDFSLHDAVLIAVNFGWSDGSCTLTVIHSELSECALEFTDVSSLIVPRTLPWGPSASINMMTQRDDGEIEIEMQSGDPIVIRATALRLTSNNSVLNSSELTRYGR